MGWVENLVDPYVGRRGEIYVGKDRLNDFASGTSASLDLVARPLRLSPRAPCVRYFWMQLSDGGRGYGGGRGEDERGRECGRGRRSIAPPRRH